MKCDNLPHSKTHSSDAATLVEIAPCGYAFSYSPQTRSEITAPGRVLFCVPS